MTIDPTSLLIKACSKGRSINDVIGEMIVDTFGQVVIDLSGGAQTLNLLIAPYDIKIKWVLILYDETSSADAGIALELGYIALSGYETGRTTDRNEFLESTTEISKAQWYTKKETTMLLDKLQKGEMLTIYSPGGKTGTGTVWVFVGYERYEAAAQTPK